MSIRIKEKTKRHDNHEVHCLAKSPEQREKIAGQARFCKKVNRTVWFDSQGNCTCTKC